MAQRAPWIDAVRSSSALARLRAPAMLAVCWVAAVLMVAWPSRAQAPRQRTPAAHRARRAPRVIHLDELDCDMARWPEPMLVPVTSPSACPMGALFVACGLEAPAACPADEPSLAAVASRCDTSHAVLLAMVRVAAEQGLAALPAAILERFAAASVPPDETDRLLLADLFRRASRYDLALARFVDLIDGAHDPAIRALALERVIAILEYEDWDEDGQLDADFATHFELPRLPDRPWALEVAVRALPRVGCLQPHATALGAIRRRFGHDPEGVIAMDHAQTLAGAERRAFLAESLAACRAEHAPCVERLLDHVQDEVVSSLRQCASIEPSSPAWWQEPCREALVLATWLGGERALPTLEGDVAAVSARLAWATAPGTVTTAPVVELATSRVERRQDFQGDLDPWLVRRTLSRLPLASCPPPPSAVLALVEVSESGQVQLASNTTSPCIAQALGTLAPITPGAEGGPHREDVIFVFPAP